MSLFSVMDNMLGFFCAPFIYGAIYEATKQDNPRLAMSFTNYYVILGVVLIIIGVVLRQKDFAKKEFDKNQSVKDHIRRKTDPRITIPTLESTRVFTENLETEPLGTESNKAINIKE